MSSHEVRLVMKPLLPQFVEVYRRRGISVPTLSSGDDPAALVPYQFRTFHQMHARLNGYFWLPCPVCARPFGGHEITDTIPDPDGPPLDVMICPACSASMNGGKP